MLIQWADSFKKADLFDLFPGHKHDKATKIWIQKAMAEVFTYCYSEEYLDRITEVEEVDEDFESCILPHIVVISVAHYFQITELVEAADMQFAIAWSYWYSDHARHEYERICTAMQKCFSRDFHKTLGLYQQATDLLEDVAFDYYEKQIENWTKERRFDQICDLHSAVPQAAVKWYSQYLHRNVDSSMRGTEGGRGVTPDDDEMDVFGV